MSFVPMFRERELGIGQFFLAPLLFFLNLFGFSSSCAMETSLADVEGQAKIVVSTNLVLLPVNVTDRRGTFVGGLKLQDFHVYEDRQLQELTVFEEGDTPVT